MSIDGAAKFPNPSTLLIGERVYGSSTLFTASDLGVFAKLEELGSADTATLARHSRPTFAALSCC